MKQFKKQPFAKKSLGQNFLVDQDYIIRIIDSLDIQLNETVIEIGPGRGALTQHLVETGANVIAIELDRNLVPMLRNEFKGYDNFQVIEADALEIDFTQFRNPDGNSKIKLVANLPYYISTAILQRLIEQREIFSHFVLMLQREVVDRITAKVGDSERGYLSVLVETYCEAQKLFDVPPDAFRPIPKVWSSVAELTVRQAQTAINESEFRELVSLGFMQKRKTILNNLKNKYSNAREILENCAIEPNRRAESLSIEEWLTLSEKTKAPE